MGLKAVREERIRAGYAMGRAMASSKMKGLSSFKRKTQEKRVKGLVRTHSRKYLNKVGK